MYDYANDRLRRHDAPVRTRRLDRRHPQLWTRRRLQTLRRRARRNATPSPAAT
ncbi:MAG: hypothetical protein MZU97_26475 [Bacillus subtilis]|nr:hypothetical protein [Bacillus subtilis]